MRHSIQTTKPTNRRSASRLDSCRQTSGRIQRETCAGPVRSANSAPQRHPREVTSKDQRTQIPANARGRSELAQTRRRPPTKPSARHLSQRSDHMDQVETWLRHPPAPPKTRHSSARASQTKPPSDALEQGCTDNAGRPPRSDAPSPMRRLRRRRQATSPEARQTYSRSISYPQYFTSASRTTSAFCP